MKYIISKEELLDLVRNVYEEGYCGYMDLKDSICDRFVENLVKDKINQEVTASSDYRAIGSVGPATTSARINWDIALNGRTGTSSASNITVGMIDNRHTTSSAIVTSDTSPSVDGSGIVWTSGVIGSNYYYSPTSSESTSTLESDDPELRADNMIRSEDYVRSDDPELNNDEFLERSE